MPSLRKSGSLLAMSCTAAMADLQMVTSEEAAELGLSSTMVEREEYEAAVARHREKVKAALRDGPKPTESELGLAVDSLAASAAAAADAVLFEDGPQEGQEEAPEELDVSVEAGVARKPRRARKPAPGDDAGQFIPDDPATPDVNEAYESAGA